MFKSDVNLQQTNKPTPKNFYDAFCIYLGKRFGSRFTEQAGQDICESEHGCGPQPATGVHQDPTKQRGRQRSHCLRSATGDDLISLASEVI